MQKLIIALTILTLIGNVFADTVKLEFRTDGFFATPDGDARLYWDSGTKRCRLNVKGKDVVSFIGPANARGTRSAWYGAAPKLLIDTQARKIVIKEDHASGSNCQLSMSESDGGVLLEIEGVSAEDNAAENGLSVFRILFPVSYFAGSSASWGKEMITLPKDFSKAGSTFFSDSNAKFPVLQMEIDKSLRLSVAPQTECMDAYLSDCRLWDENNYNLFIKMKNGKCSLLLKLNNTMEPEKNAAISIKKGNLLSEGASFECGPDGFLAVNTFSWNDPMTTPGEKPIFDTSTAVHGKTSLKLKLERPADHNGRFSFRGVIFKRTLLERGKSYTLSAWLKADRPGIKANMFCGDGSAWSAGEWSPFEVSTEWKRYHMEFKTGDFKKSGLFFTWISPAALSTEGNLWIDAVQLEEGPMTDFKPSSEIEYGVEMKSPCKLFERTQDCEAVIRVRNNSDKLIKETMNYEISDFLGRQVRKGTMDFQVEANENLETMLNLGILPSGYYKMLCKFPGENEEATFGVYRPQPLTLLPDDWPLACHVDPSPVARKIGFGMVRVFHVFEFAKVAPSAGSFDFSQTDKFVEKLEQSGLSAMPIFSKFDWPYYDPLPPIPPYAQNKIEERTFLGSKVRLVWPKIEAWKCYVKALVSHYKGRIKYWEVINEANLYMTADEYLPYLKAAYEAAKEADPEVKIVGLCATSDFQGHPDSFSQQSFKLGAHNYFDLFSVHMYERTAPESTMGHGSDKALEGWRRLLKNSYGKTSDIWHTEKMYIPREFGYSQRKVATPPAYCSNQFAIEKRADQANWMIRETLLSAAGGGHGKFFWFGSFYEPKFISHQIFMPYTEALTEYDDSPTPALVAANGLATALNGMHSPVCQMEWGETIRCALFNGNKGTMVALWSPKGKATINMPVAGVKYEVLDFFGEPVSLSANSQGSIQIEIDESPKYVRFEGMSANECHKLIEKTRLTDVCPALIGSMTLIEGSPAWRFLLTNPQLTAVDASLTLACPDGWTSATAQQKITAIPPGVQAAASFPVTRFPGCSEGDIFTVKNLLDGKSYDFQYKSLPYASKEQLINLLTIPEHAVATRVNSGSIVIDGNFSDWTEEGNMSLATNESVKETSGADSWKGPYDCSISIRLRWDESFLYIAARILDDKIVYPESPKDAYTRDCLEIFIKTGTIFQGLFFPYDSNYSGPKAWWIQKASDMGTKVACKFIPNGYQLEIAIPWSELAYHPQKGDKLPFTFHLNDSDKPGQFRKTLMIWKGDGLNYKSPAQWGDLLLK